LPGEGFGDFSHETTRLALKMMSPYVKGNTVIDIGCGSGILSLAAALLGAHQVYGIDVDPLALEHSRRNLKINRLEKAVHFSERVPPLSLKKPPLIVMNMIPPEQEVAWKSQINIHSLPKHLITSGVLVECRKGYLKWALSQGWTYLAEDQKDKWLSFRFIHNPLKY